MTDKNTEKLINRFPNIFEENFYFECDDGWFDIIFDLCKDVQQEVNNSSCQQVVAAQVKEKFAGLRFYASGGNEVTDAIINKYSKLSSETCEMTGGKGYLCEKHRWYKTLSTQSAILLGFKKCE
mgnify:FL=1|jgi:hypothetical protein